MLPSGEITPDATPAAAATTIIAHVDIRIASPKDSCAVLIFITAAGINDETGNTSISIKNESDELITVYQAQIHFNSKDERSQYLVTIPPNVWVPFGWADPFIEQQVREI